MPASFSIEATRQPSIYLLSYNQHHKFATLSTKGKTMDPFEKENYPDWLKEVAEGETLLGFHEWLELYRR